MYIAYYGEKNESFDKLQEYTKKYIKKNRLYNSCIKEYTDSTEVLNDCAQDIPIDMIFIDLDAEELAGLELAHTLREIGSEAMIVLIASTDSYMPEAFKVEAFDYLLQPLQKEQVVKTFSRAVEKYNKCKGFLTIRENTSRVIKMSLDDIVYIKGHLHSIIFYLKNGAICKSNKKVSEVAEYLAPHPQFLRIHQSYIVNLDYVLLSDGPKLLIRKPFDYITPKVPISRVHLKPVREYLANYKTVCMIDSTTDEEVEETEC